MPKTTFGRFARRVVRKRLQRILDDGTMAVARGRDNELHALRIAGKRLRYNLEFSAALATDGARASLDLLARLQERLGTIADAATFEKTYCRLLDGLAQDDPRRPGLEALRDAARSDGARELSELRAYWLEEPPYPERLAASISAALGSGSPKPEP